MLYWYLEGCFAGDKQLRRQTVRSFPFVIGREENISLSIFTQSISRRHAQIECDGDKLLIKDLGSKNGTFLNRQRVSAPTMLNHGDVISVGDVELRFLQTETDPEETRAQSAIMISRDLSNRVKHGAKELEQIINDELITTAFQSIVDRNNNATLGYEILGRGTSELLPKSPGGLFGVAESVGLEVPLSELMRKKGVEIAYKAGLVGQLFVNTHPAELQSPDRLLMSIDALHQRFPQLSIMLEIHEQAITDMKAIKFIKSELKKMSVEIAYDDFGVGQSRLLELVEATPDVLKFDMMLTRDIDQAPPAKVQLVTKLHELAQKLNIKTLAECISSPKEYSTCRTIGFDYFQGYLFGEPKYPSVLNVTG